MEKSRPSGAMLKDFEDLSFFRIAYNFLGFLKHRYLSEFATITVKRNLVLRALFHGFKAWEKRPGNEVV